MTTVKELKKPLTEHQRDMRFIGTNLLLILVTAVLSLVFALVVDYLMDTTKAAKAELNTEHITLVANELNLEPSEIIIENSLLNDYETFITSKGEYKATFNYENGKSEMLSLVKVIEAE